METLAAWVARPFDIAHNCIETNAIHGAIMMLLRAYPNWEVLLTLAASHVKELRDTLYQYHTSVDLALEAESSLLRYDQCAQIKTEAVVAGKRYS